MTRSIFLARAAAFAAAALVTLPPSASSAEAAAQTLPGGATSLQETFVDWQVGCAVREATKRCAITQEQVNQQSRQRVLAVELTTAGDKLEGMLIAPFGLALDRGITLQIDEQPSLPTLKFSTCLPGGCLVPLGFDAKTTAALKAGSALKVRAVPAGGGQDLLYTISLKGFAQGLDRVVTLLK